MMKIERLVGGNLETNGYIVYVKDGGDAFCIDTGFDYKWYIDYAMKHQLTIKGVLLTHHHYDHSTAAPKLARELDIPIYIHRNDLEMLEKLFKKDMCLVEFFDEDRKFVLEDREFYVINTPGHTRGGVFFVNEKDNIAFTGDTVFSQEIGITDLEDGNWQDMANTCKYIFAKLPKDMTIYPGHGDSAKVSFVLENNKELQEAIELAK